MQDVTPSPILLERNGHDSKITDVDYGIESRSHTLANGKYRRLSRQEAFRQTSHKQHKKPDHPPLIPDHENNWEGLMKDVPDFDAFDIPLNMFVKENFPRPVVRDMNSVGQRRTSESLDVKEKDSLSDAELVEYFAERMRQLPLRYGFKSPERFNILQKAMSMNHDKNTNSRHNQFGRQNLYKSLSPTESIKSGSNSFKSKHKRKVILPKIDSTSDHHKYQTSMNGPVITSSFRSNTERFPKKLGKNIPGPGMYDRVIGLPTQKQVGSYLSRGIYFNSSFS
ncbi:hypothetical protein I4U23_009769 [Adineta vaga]|nr:hypothetical protein I4U23_009769 [Adineta vaga]